MTTVTKNTETRSFRKKPVVIEAIRLPLPGEDQQKVADLFDFMGAAEWEIGIDGMYIKTLEGTMHASPGDWIIRDVKGELYPCKPDIFAATYEPESTLAKQATQAAGSREAPGDWVRVLRDPTDAMTFVGQKHRYDRAWSIGAIYRDMLAAAPKPPQAEGVLQVDREAAKLLRQEIVRQLGPRPNPDNIEDDDFDVRLFAAHRLAAASKGEPQPTYAGLNQSDLRGSTYHPGDDA